MSDDLSDDLIDEILFTQKPRGDSLVVDEVVRALTVDDIESIAEGHLDYSPVQGLTAIRETHHALARALARGLKDVEASALTGYTPSTISRYRKDPAFQELLATYVGEANVAFAEVVDRMRMLGLSTIDELQERLETDPRGWTKRELMDMAKMCLVDSGKAQGQMPSGGFGAPTATVNIKFVQAAEVAPLVEIQQGQQPVLQLQGDLS